MQKSAETDFNHHSIILFDGVCNLCNGFVQFIIKRDDKAVFVFTSLQSDIAQQLLKQHDFNLETMSSVVLLEKNKLYTESTAALKILKQLTYWKVFYVFIILPQFFRDWLYRLIAKHRYRIFGKRATCMIPTPELQNRFME